MVCPQTTVSQWESHYFLAGEAGSKVDNTHQTQVNRALSQLGIERIAAYSPEARGRSARASRTLLDRLIKEMSLAKIDDIETANRFIRETYIQEHNKRFAVTPKQATSAFVADRDKRSVDILCIQEERSARPDNNRQLQTSVFANPRDPAEATFRSRQGARPRISRRTHRAVPRADAPGTIQQYGKTTEQR